MGVLMGKMSTLTFNENLRASLPVAKWAALAGVVFVGGMYFQGFADELEETQKVALETSKNQAQLAETVKTTAWILEQQQEQIGGLIKDTEKDRAKNEQSREILLRLEAKFLND